jgi:hypothetical protein
MSTTMTPNDLTRQQLDDLDRLLQRMLSLPLNKPEPPHVPRVVTPPLPEMPPISGVWRSDGPAEVKTPHIATEQSFSAVMEPEVMLSSHGFGTPRPAPSGPSAFAVVPPSAEMPYPMTGTLRGVDAPATPMGFKSAFASSNDRPVALADLDTTSFAGARYTPTPEPIRQTAVPVILWPLFVINWILEAVLGWTGPIGNILLQPWMKRLLGFTGIALAVAAGVWVAMGLGWISWPR